MAPGEFSTQDPSTGFRSAVIDNAVFDPRVEGGDVDAIVGRIGIGKSTGEPDNTSRFGLWTAGSGCCSELWEQQLCEVVCRNAVDAEERLNVLGGALAVFDNIGAYAGVIP